MMLHIALKLLGKVTVYITLRVVVKALRQVRSCSGLSVFRGKVIVCDRTMAGQMCTVLRASQSIAMQFRLDSSLALGRQIIVCQRSAMTRRSLEGKVRLATPNDSTILHVGPAFHFLIPQSLRLSSDETAI